MKHKQDKICWWWKGVGA